MARALTTTQASTAGAAQTGHGGDQRANAAAEGAAVQRHEDSENATRGFVGKPDALTIKGEKGNVVWDLEEYKKYIGFDKPAPDSVNPSLWRNAQLNMQYGLFKVTDKIYQVRGYDLSNITFVHGNKGGWIVFDPLISTETAKAAYELVTKHLRQSPCLPWSLAIRTWTTTAACAASWTRRR